MVAIFIASVVLVIFGAAYIAFSLPPEPFTSDKEIIARTENLPAVKAFVTKYPYANSSLQRGSDMLVSYWVAKSDVEGELVNNTIYEPELILQVWQNGKDPAASRLHLICSGGNATVNETTGANTHSKFYVIEDSQIVPFLEEGKEEDCFNTNQVRGEWLECPKYKVVVRIIERASLEGSERYLDPQIAAVIIGLNDTVQWINEDSVPHAITSDDDYRDPISGLFDSRERPAEEGGPFVMPQDTYEFTFTEPGVYPYHHEPHPWVQGTVIVLES